MKTTLNSFIASSSLPEKLIRAVVRQIGGYSDFIEHAQDVTEHGANSGFNGFIYYNETVPFTTKNRASILEYAEAQASDFGTNMLDMFSSFGGIDLTPNECAEALYNSKSDNRQELYNVLAWYALEEVARSYVDMLENQEAA